MPCNEKLYAMYGAGHSASFRCIHAQSRGQRPHKVWRSPSVQWSICREWNCRHWEESKTVNRGQCQNQQGVGYAGRFGKDDWESTYFKTLWMTWNWHSYSRDCLLYWLGWLLVVETSSLTVKKPQYWSSMNNYGYEHTAELDTGVALASLQIMRIHPRVSEESKIQQIPPTLHNTGGMDHRQVDHGSFGAIPILDPVDVENGYSYSAICHYCLQWHDWSHGWRYASFG